MSITTDPSRLHEGAVVIDGTCPGAHWRANVETWLAGGTTCCVLTVGSPHPPAGALYDIAEAFRFIRNHPRLRLATSVADIRAAKADGVMAVVLQFQGTEPMEYETSLVEPYWRMGVRIVQLAYNRRGPVCDGCEEPNDAGLSVFGRRMVAELNRVGIVVDVSHTGVRSALEAVEASAAPVIASHSNARSVYANERNLPDDLIRAIAASGGVIGMNGWPSFVSGDAHPSLDQYIDHMAYISDLVGAQHVALGVDYWNGTQAQYDEFIANGTWKAENYPPPPWPYPQGIEDASGFPRLTARLFERGFGEDDVRGILGENWLRVYGQAWREEPAPVLVEGVVA
ncbi:MAG: rane dipeptidase [Sphaerisporangium sp.]|nr:rane dipeptidase [Sphaerisporangium sp.]